MKTRFRIVDIGYVPFIGARFEIYEKVTVVPYIWYMWTFRDNTTSLAEAEQKVLGLIESKTRDTLKPIIVKEY